MEQEELTSRHFRQLGFTNLTDTTTDHPTYLVFQYRDDKTDLIFQSRVGEAWWLVKDGRAGSNRTYCDILLPTNILLRIVLGLFKGNLLKYKEEHYENKSVSNNLHSSYGKYNGVERRLYNRRRG